LRREGELKMAQVNARGINDEDGNEGKAKGPIGLGPGRLMKHIH
jgi:hypothetical protein